MKTLGPDDGATCTVLTWKEGVLSAVAHDLRITVERLTVSVDGDALTARFDATSLRTQCARRDGADDKSALSAADKRKIDDTIAKDVLDARRFPEIVARAQLGAGAPRSVSLTLHGVTRDVPLVVETRGDVAVARARIHQPDFGIKPYTALLGALKLKPDLDVVMELPARVLPAR